MIDYTHSAHSIPAPGAPNTPNIYGNRLTNNAVAVGRRIGFYNVNDYALNTDAWCFDQALKPDSFGLSYYAYAGSTNDAAPWNHFELRFSIGGYTPLDIVTNLSDRYDALAWAANPYSKALGATPGVTNLVNLDLQTIWPSDSIRPSNPFSEHFYHSAEFRGDYWQELNYWNTLLHSDTLGFNIQN